ncbi:nucleoporin Nup37 [Brachionus plicatilis]|uniref:Nucleoporin Nup37 n=1 Tax=Brachionus plicatilis TaxID=10195 RepID=A0A3M7TAV2_BRAPC|nr:nucleoporin Nup37 [Brachionus plicatilis]
MSIEASQKFNKTVKIVDFFPFEWSANLISVCFDESVQLFKFHESSLPPENIENSQLESCKLSLILSVSFEQKIQNFTWNPKSVISSLKPLVSFAVNDSAQNVIFITSSTISDQAEHQPDQGIQRFAEKFDVDCIYSMSFDSHSGENLAFTADNSLYLWDCVGSRLRAKFSLQSPGASVCWHRDEHSKFMVAETSGLIRIYSIETLRPVYSLLCYNDAIKRIATPILSFDWSQLSPEIIVANTCNEILIWNTSRSSLPEKVVDSFDRLKKVKLCNARDNLVGFIDGNDACSKFTILNFKTNQTLYQSKNLKLLNSFSFSSVLPILAIASEQQVTIKKISA